MKFDSNRKGGGLPKVLSKVESARPGGLVLKSSASSFPLLIILPRTRLLGADDADSITLEDIFIT